MSMKKSFIALVMAGVVALTSLCGGVIVYAADETVSQAEDDFLIQNGLEITPNGKVTLPAAVCKSLDSVDNDGFMKPSYYFNSELRTDTVEDVEAYFVVKKDGCGVKLPKNHVGMISAFRKDGTVAWCYGNSIFETTDSILVDTNNVDSWGSPIDEYVFMFCPLTNSFYEEYKEKIINFEGEKLTFADFSFIPRENMRFFKYDGVTKQLTQKITTANIKTYKASDLKKKKVSFSLKAKATGSEYLHYSVVVSNNLKKYIEVSDSGKVTLKKGAKKGTYKIKIMAYGNGAYKDATKTISIKVK